jgi:protoporphyrinogen oxidase
MTKKREVASSLSGSTRNIQTVEAEHVISSASMRGGPWAHPPVSERAKHAADSLKYRDFLTVMLILKERHMFDDN